jgi:hypothetical protein
MCLNIQFTVVWDNTREKIGEWVNENLEAGYM